MALIYYDADKNPLGSTPLRSFHDGLNGSAHEQKFYIRNTDSTKYYTNITLTPQFGIEEDYADLGNSGWSIKLMYGERQPSEIEWSYVRSGDSISLPDIGNTDAADTSKFYPVWVRIYAPGGTDAKVRTSTKIVRSCYVRNVGA